MTDRPAAVISDANVLIDYISVEETEAITESLEELRQETEAFITA